MATPADGKSGALGPEFVDSPVAVPVDRGPATPAGVPDFVDAPAATAEAPPEPGTVAAAPSMPLPAAAPQERTWARNVAAIAAAVAIVAIIVLAIRMKPGSPPVAPQAGEEVGQAVAHDWQVPGTDASTTTPQTTAATVEPALGANGASQQTQQSPGSAEGSCPGCGGTGVMACPMKHLPNGHLLNPLFWAEERYYSGRDPLLPEDADMGVCPRCGGTLQVPCDSCSGTGRATAQPQPGQAAGIVTPLLPAVNGESAEQVMGRLLGGGGE